LPLPDDDNGFYNADQDGDNCSESELRSSTPKQHRTDEDHDDGQGSPYYRETDSATPDSGDTSVQYEPVPYSAVPYADSPTVNKPSTDFIDTSIPFVHPDMQRATYETVDQIKFKINKEIELERTSSPIGREFIVFAS